MANELVFDVRFMNDLQQGQQVDSDLYVELWEDGGASAKETRTIGTDINANIIEAQDGSGYFYITTVDVGDYVEGDVTGKWYAKLAGNNIEPYPFEETLSYPYDTALNASTLKNYVLAKLGYPAVLVELSESSHINTALTDALDIYNAFVGRENKLNVTMLSGQNRYILAEVGSRGVANVEFVRKTGTPLISDPLFGREYPRGQQLDFDQYQLGISFWETLMRSTGMEPDWIWKPDERALYLNIGQHEEVFAGGDYYITVTHYENLPVEQIPSNHHWWVKRYVLAVCKEILGRIRGKFGGQVPQPGGAVTLDGRELLEESKAEKEDLEEKVRGLGPVIPASLG
jgi:hypothetical protein